MNRLVLKRYKESIDWSSKRLFVMTWPRLKRMGYLEKAHTSSGRMPSRAGFQYFVANSLNLDTIDEQDVYQVVKAFDFEAFKLEDILDAAAKLLAEMTGCKQSFKMWNRRQRLTGFEDCSSIQSRRFSGSNSR